MITSNSTSDLEVITLSRSNITVGSNPSVYANSSKFNLNLSNWQTLPRMMHSYQWVTGAGGVNASYSINYWSNPYLTTYYGSSPTPTTSRSISALAPASS